MFETLIVATALLCLAGIWVGSRYYRDTFHPLVYLSALLGTLYVGYPTCLIWEGDIWSYLSEDSLVALQSIYLAGVAAMLIGVWRGAGVRIDSNLAKATVLGTEQKRYLGIAAMAVGLVGVAGYAYCILSVGGIEAAFGESYGGGWSDSGYLRETFLLTLPALLWLMITYQSGGLIWYTWGRILLVASPLLTQGFLGARRGPTFMGLAGLTVGWYLMRQRRPRLLVALLGGALVGGLLLFLVSNRGEIYLGSELHLEASPLDYVKAGGGNEYLYGGALILHSQEQGGTFWGRRYLQFFFIRPIPRAWWPAKYDVASELLGGVTIEGGTAGLATNELKWTVGWAGAPGATPGIIADLWLEFWWFGSVGLFGIGWIYGRIWRMATLRGGPWLPCFGVVTALSIYLVMQCLEAMGFRALFMLGSSTVIWYFGKYGDSRSQSDQRSVEVRTEMAIASRPAPH